MRAAELTTGDIVRRRLANQHLVDPTIDTPAEVVRRLGAVQAQDYAGAKWGVGMRTRGAVDEDVERAVADGSIVRTHVLRPTWHFVAAADVRWMLALTAPRVKATMASYDRKLGLDDTTFRRSSAALVRALRDGKQLTRAELAEAIRRAGVDATGTQRLAHLVLRAELDGVVCSGARRGKQFTYALLEERVPSAAPLDREASLFELTTRYFATRGPATTADFAWWSGLTVADARRGIEIASANLERATVDGRTYWTASGVPAGERATPARRQRRPIAHLLPNYDEYFIGFKDRSAIATRVRSAELVTGGDARVTNVVIIDGQLVGGWRRTLAPDSVVIELKPLARLTGAEERAVAAAAAAYEKFLGVPAELRRVSASTR